MTPNSNPQAFILSLDQGTTSSRAMVFDTAGSVVAVQQQEFTQHFPQSGWVEHDAMEIWHSQLHVAQQVLSVNGIEPNQIAAIGITNQRETTVLWDKTTGQSVANAIVWQDRRTAPLCDALRQAGHADTIAAKTGLVLDSYFSATKLAWLLDNVPNARAQAAAGRLAFGTVDSWLMWQLTGGKVHATDVSNASRTMLWNIHTQSWDADLLALLNIPASVLPKVQPSSGLFGRTKLLGGDLAIAGVAGDQQAATFGQACWEPGMVKNTYGTGCFLLCNTGSSAVASQHRLLTTAGWQLPDQALQYCMEGSVFMGGATVQWLRDGLGIIQKASEIESLAASVPDSGGVMLVPAFTGLGAPHWDAQARGTLLGLSRGTTRAHIARAALEGIAHQVADVALAMQADMQAAGGQPIQELRVDGGAAANDLLLQIQADLLQIPVVRPKVTETTALGAAYLAGLAAGFWASQDVLASQWQVDRRFTPTPGSTAWQTGARGTWQRALERAGQWYEQ